jgi:hypothetical protein
MLGGAPPAYPPHAGYGAPVDARARTVYVGSVSAGADDGMLRALFATCGTVTAVRLTAVRLTAVAGDPSQSARFAFVEFAEPRRGGAARCAAACVQKQT